MVWLLWMTLSTALAWDKCPGELPPGFEESYASSARTAFEANFRRTMAIGVVQGRGVPEGWERESFLTFTESWWAKELAVDIEEVGDHMVNRSLQVIREGPLCAKMAAISVPNPDPALLQQTMGELQMAMGPLNLETAQQMQARLTEERRKELTGRFEVDIAKAQPH